jgi:hypothetical protein
MNASLWSDILADVASAEKHFTGAIDLVEAGAFAGKGLDLYRGEMAVMHAMVAAHSSVEAALQRLLAVLGEPMPTGGDWHTDLLRRVSLPPEDSRPAVISATLFEALDETRRFRPDRATPAIEAAEVARRMLRAELTAFRDALDGE